MFQSGEVAEYLNPVTCSSSPRSGPDMVQRLVSIETHTQKPPSATKTQTATCLADFAIRFAALRESLSSLNVGEDLNPLLRRLGQRGPCEGWFGHGTGSPRIAHCVFEDRVAENSKFSCQTFRDTLPKWHKTWLVSFLLG